MDNISFDLKVKLQAALDLCHKNLTIFLLSCIDSNFADSSDENHKFFRFLKLAIIASINHSQDVKCNNVSQVVREGNICYDAKKINSFRTQTHESKDIESTMSLAVNNFKEQFPYFVKKYMIEANFEQFETDEFHPAYYFLVCKIINLEIEHLNCLEVMVRDTEDSKSNISSLVRFIVSPTFSQSLVLMAQTRCYDIYCFSSPCGKKALKVLKSSCHLPEDIESLNNELELSRKFSHPAFRKALMKTTYKNQKALLLDWAEGEPLSDLILSVPSFLNIAREIVSALVSMHASNMMHTNLTSEHIILNSEDKTINIIGIGSCSAFSCQKNYITYPKQLKMDLRYVSPEETGRNNRITDFRSDFYSLGVIFYRLLTGKYPFESNNMIKLMNMHILQICPPVHHINLDIPVAVSNMIAKLMEKNAEHRYKSAKGILYDLDLMISEYKSDSTLKSVVLAKHDISETLILPQGVHGRALEYKTMMSALDRVNAGAYELLFVTGESGIGKSVFVMELYKPLAQRNGYLCLGKFDRSKSFPYSAILDAIRNLCDTILLDDVNTTGNYRSKIKEAIGEEGVLLTDVIPNLHLIVGQQPSVAEVSGLDAKNRFNYVFMKFIRAICSVGRPITLILEDLQWADGESLNLLSLLFSDNFMSNLLFIGVYRNNEVNVGHQLLTTLQNIEAKRNLTKIELPNLNHKIITELVSSALYTNLLESYSLVALILEKTKGNPFFVKQFLKSLYEQKLIYFCFHERKWKWDNCIFSKIDIADSILDLLRKKMLTLKDSTQQVMKIASCLGNSFSLSVLKLIIEHDNAIEEALSTGMIVQSKGNGTTYKFLHDQIQQAAFSLVPNSKRNEIFLRISSKLRKSLSNKDLDKNIYVIMNLLLPVSDLVKNKDERVEMANLALHAGKKAIATAAFKHAFKYLNFGLNLLCSDCWKTSYDLSLGLYDAAAEAAFCISDFTNMNKFTQEVLNNATTLLHKVKFYILKIRMYNHRRMYEDAPNVGLSFLGKIGYKLLQHHEVEVTKTKLKEMLQQKNISLKKMINEYSLSVISILSYMIGCCFTSKPKLLPVIAAGMVQLTLEHGISKYSATGFALFGSILNPADKLNIECGRLASVMQKHYSTKECIPDAEAILYGVLSYRVEIIHRSIRPLFKSYQTCLEVGRNISSIISAGNYALTAFHSGKCLYDLASDIERIDKELPRKTTTFCSVHQAILNLMDDECGNPALLTGATFNYKSNFRERTCPVGVAAGLGNCLVLSYLFHEYSEAWKIAEEVRPLLKLISNYFHHHIFIFYDGLISFELSRQTKEEKYMKQAEESIAKFRVITEASLAPENYVNKLHLLEAEKANVLGDRSKAISDYRASITLSRKFCFVHEEALAHERAGMFFLEINLNRASDFFTQSYQCYSTWGASTKMNHIASKYPNLCVTKKKCSSLPLHSSSVLECEGDSSVSEVTLSCFSSDVMMTKHKRLRFSEM